MDNLYSSMTTALLFCVQMERPRKQSHSDRSNLRDRNDVCTIESLYWGGPEIRMSMYIVNYECAKGGVPTPDSAQAFSWAAGGRFIPLRFLKKRTPLFSPSASAFGSTH